MNAVNDFYITIILDKKRFFIRIQQEGDPSRSKYVIVATGSGFTNIQESPAGWGDTVEQAVEALLCGYGWSRYT